MGMATGHQVNSIGEAGIGTVRTMSKDYSAVRFGNILYSLYGTQLGKPHDRLGSLSQKK